MKIAESFNIPKDNLEKLEKLAESLNTTKDGFTELLTRYDKNFNMTKYDKIFESLISSKL